MFLCHILVIPAILQSFPSLLYFLWWSVISGFWCYYYKKFMSHWRLRRWLAFFINNFFFLLHHAAWGTLIPHPGIEPDLWQWKHRVLTTGLPVQFSSVAQSCLTLCNPMNCNTPGLPVHHQLPKFTQTHVHRVGDAIQPSHPLSFPSPPALNSSQHQSLFQWVISSHEVAKVLDFQL